MTTSIAYFSRGYESLARTAADYSRIMQQDYELTRDVSRADLVILHCDPLHYPTIYRVFPQLSGKYVIGYCVWEADRLPKSYLPGLQLVQEVWTCSRYCYRSFSQHHGMVHVVPHVVDPHRDYSREELEQVDRDISYSDENINFLCSGHMWDTRKNLPDLVSLFERLRKQMPKARLIVKTFNSSICPTEYSPSVRFVNRLYTRREVAALWSRTHAFISPLHSEGWGLMLSDAMFYGLPTVATGYSGNCDFMNDCNSFLVEYEIKNIKDEHCFRNYTSEMQWAYPRASHLAHQLKRLYEMIDSRNEVEMVRMGEAGRRSVGEYSFDKVDLILRERIAASLCGVAGR